MQQNLMMGLHRERKVQFDAIHVRFRHLKRRDDKFRQAAAAVQVGTLETVETP